MDCMESQKKMIHLNRSKIQNGIEQTVVQNGHTNGPTDEEWEIVEQTFKLITEKLSFQAQRNSKIIDYKTPADLMKSMDLKLSADPVESTKYLMDIGRNIVDNSVKTGHPNFRNIFWGGCDPYGFAATILIEALHTSNYTFEVAPVLQLIEREVIQNLTQLCGYQDGDGIFCPGGSLANMYALSLARHNLDPTIKQKGMQQNTQQLIIFTSEQSHYSVFKGAFFLGFGTEQMVGVKCDQYGSMDPAQLELQIQKAIAENKKPLMVFCTTPTTVLNAIDPIDKVSAVCQKYKIWLHVDACIGGCFLLSDKYRHMLAGIEKSDSMTWDWHKILGAPLQTSVFLTKHKKVLETAHTAKAAYLFGVNRYYDTSVDIGDKAITCGRKADALKVWLMWKARGKDGLGQQVDEIMDVLHYIWMVMRKDSRFQLLAPKPQGLSICFRMVPSRLQPDSPELNAVCLALKKRMVQDGHLMIACLPDPSTGVHFFRWTMICHPRFTREDADRIIDILLDLTEQI